MFVQSSTITRLTKTIQDRQLDNVIRDISGLASYVDSQVGSNNELNEILANGNSTGGNDISLTTGDKILFNNSGFQLALREPTLAGNIGITMPSSGGTLALTSDIPAVNNLYSNDGTITDNARMITLAGDTTSQYLGIEKNNGQDLILFKGNGQVYMGNLSFKQGASGEMVWNFGGDLATDGFAFQNASGTDMLTVDGTGVTKIYKGLIINATNQTGNPFDVEAGNSNGYMATFSNTVGTAVVDVRTVSNGGRIRVFNSGGTVGGDFHGQNGTMEVSSNYICNGSSGIGGAGGTTYNVGGTVSGDLASITITGGIITAVTTVP